MDHRIPRTGVVVSIVLAIGALITFLFLNNRFEGPDPTELLTSSFELTAEFESTKKLPTKQPVLYRGISIGRVNEVSWDPEARVSVVTFTLEDDFEIHDDAVLQIGERSLLGDPYLNLLTRGTDSAPELDAGDEVTQTKASVDFDEALAFLDDEGRERVKSLIGTVGRGLSPEGNGAALNATIGGATQTVEELNELTLALEGQEEELSRLISDAGTVLSTIGDREDSVRTIVGQGRRTLDALARNTDSVDRALAELPPLLETGRTTLAEAEPLIDEAGPLVADLTALAPDLRVALDDSREYSLARMIDELLAITKGLEPLRRVAVPVLGDLKVMLLKLEPLVRAIAPATRNLVPALDYLVPRVNAIAGLYALVAANAEGTDSVGNYLRAGFTFEPGEFNDTPTPPNCDPATQNNPGNQGFCYNPYPGPNDALNPQPFTGEYPRILPCTVPPRSRPTDPCE
jgi:phospholipid/cholesterol/gamma-HCH transport system substrate-binding protein